MPEDDVGDDLLEARVVLHLGARLEEMALANDALVAVEVVGDEPMPRAVGKHVRAPHDEDLLGRDRAQPG